MGAEQTPDYASMTAAELAAAESAAVAAFDEKKAGEVNAAVLAELTGMAQEINTIRAAQAQVREAEAQVTALAEMIHGTPGTEPDAGEDPDNIQHADGDDPVTADSVADERVPELVAAAPKTDVRDVLKTGKNLNAHLASLTDAQKHVPQAPALEPRRESVLVASADIPGFAQGSRLGNLDQLIGAVTARARNLQDRSGPVHVASLNREFEFNLNFQSTAEQIQNTIDAVTDPERLSLTAAGGWCAPSEISYDFYNIVCEDGLLDLPTVGINRGGIRWPTSPSFGDLAGNVWTWTETQDIAAVTGTDQSGVKPCFRVPCPDYNEARLDCDGHCLTAGNLMTDAFPELIANHLRLLFATQAHYTNLRIIQQLVTGSTAVTYTPTGLGVAVPVLNTVEQQAEDYRIKYRMCDDAVIEAVFPRWILPMFRADLIKRPGVENMMSVSNAQVIQWFNDRNIRVQFVQDWQVGAAGQLGQATPATAWPSQVQYLLYAPGTWLRGNGLRLDLGIIRDSTLNATNDYTASWMEECYLTARIGHESRLVTVPLCPNGSVAAGITFGCSI